MPNHYFSFKQFTIQQQNVAMKVCTDSCLFGAICAQEVNHCSPAPKRALDIGTGTGLLALMLAQESTLLIDAIELDALAAEQATQNVMQSMWAQRTNVIHGDVQQHTPPYGYDFIMCNPPFFEADLKSPNQAKNAAKHDTQLTLAPLLVHINRLLAPLGTAALLLPYHRTAYVESLLAQHQLFVHKNIAVQQTAAHPYFRSILLLGRENIPAQFSNMYISESDKSYSDTFRTLLAPYYLKL